MKRSKKQLRIRVYTGNTLAFLACVLFGVAVQMIAG
jgi:hypothetical protein